MASHFAAARPRRVPSQERGQRRVTSLLNAAETVIAEHGYEAATMSEIADKAGASIGSLYQFFPSKRAIAQALRMRYRHEFSERWPPMDREFGRMDLPRFVARLIDMTIQFMDEHPAFGAMLDAPRLSGGLSPMGERLAGFLTLKRPRMATGSAERIAGVAIQILRAFNRAWIEAAGSERPALKKEFRAVLVCYLAASIKTRPASPSPARRG